MAVTLGFAFEGVATKLCFRDKSQLKWRIWRMGACSERIEITPNVWCGASFVEAYSYMICYCHFSWQAEYFVHFWICGSAIYLAGAGTCEATRCGGGHCVVAGAGNRSVANCGGGESLKLREDKFFFWLLKIGGQPCFLTSRNFDVL